MNLEIAKKEFMEYVNGFDTANFNIKRKIDHSLRVMAISMKIAESLELNKENIELAELIGLLHDIGRFEQFTKYRTYNDSISIDHGKLGVEILWKDNFIRKFIEEDKNDEIIKVAIKNHNKFKVEENLDEKQELFCKIIRDADKLDILYQCTFLSWKNDIEAIENAKLKKEDIKPLIENRQIDRVKDFKQERRINHLLTDLGFVFDMNFKITFKILKESDYINKIIDRFDFKDEETKQIIEDSKNIVNTYIYSKQKG